MRAGEQEPEAHSRRPVSLLFLLGLGAGSLGLILISWGAFGSRGPEFLEVSLQSLLQANYFADHNPARVAALDPALIEDVIRDQDPEAADLAGRLATLQALLESAVPTATPSQGAPLATSTPAQAGQSTALPGLSTLTPLPGGGPAPAITGTPTPTQIQTATVESPTPLVTLASTVIPTLPGILTLTPTATLPGSSFPTATRTPVPTNTRTPEPTSTPRPTSTSTPAPTKTATNTNTPVPSSTPTPSPTSTPEPSTGLIADLSVTMSDQPDPVKPGDRLTYRIEVTNNGPADAIGVKIVDILPPLVDFDSASSGDCVATPAAVTCNIGKLSNGANDHIDIKVNVRLGAAGVITNVVSVSSDTLDDNPGNNTATAKTTVSP